MQIKIGNVVVDAPSKSDLMHNLNSIINSGDHHYVCFCEAHLCVQGTLSEDVSEILNKASLVLPDGAALTLGAKLLGKSFPERLPGPDIMIDYCRHGVSSGIKHFFYGGAEGVAGKMVENLKIAIPGLDVTGVFSPPFRLLTSEEELEVKNMIESSGADVVWVGLGAPKQEKWMAEHLGKINVPLMMGVGAAFDFHSGTRKRAPLFIRKLGFEWLYRMFTGGKRVFLRNMKYEFLFVVILFKQMFEMFAQRLRQ